MSPSKTLFLLLTTTSLTSMAHYHKAEHRHQGNTVIWLDSENQNTSRIVEGIGRICAQRSFDNNGELVDSHRNYAEQLANEDALKKCYPYQLKRISSYLYTRTNELCLSTSPRDIKETVSAQYECAR